MNGRMERAKALPVQRIGPRQYMVGKYPVDLDGETPCHCADALLTQPAPEACKHVLAAWFCERGDLLREACERFMEQSGWTIDGFKDRRERLRAVRQMNEAESVVNGGLFGDATPEDVRHRIICETMDNDEATANMSPKS